MSQLDNLLNRALSTFFGGCYRVNCVSEFRRCRECDAPFDYLRGYTTALFCEECLAQFDVLPGLEL